MIFRYKYELIYTTAYIEYSIYIYIRFGTLVMTIIMLTKIVGKLFLYILASP